MKQTSPHTNQVWSRCQAVVRLFSKGRFRGVYIGKRRVIEVRAVESTTRWVRSKMVHARTPGVFELTIQSIANGDGFKVISISYDLPNARQDDRRRGSTAHTGLTVRTVYAWVRLTSHPGNRSSEAIVHAWARVTFRSR